jgi:hypothetical protein
MLSSNAPTARPLARGLTRPGQFDGKAVIQNYIFMVILFSFPFFFFNLLEQVSIVLDFSFDARTVLNNFVKKSIRL